MQSVVWYSRRLQSMSPAEVVWRMGHLLRDSTERCTWPLRRRWQKRVPPAGDQLLAHRASVLFGTEWPSPGLLPNAVPQKWQDEAVERAERILRGFMRLIGGAELHIGEEINWNCDYKHQRTTPIVCAAAVDYRDFRIAGDAKWVWELNRHHHLVVLGRAYRYTGDLRYARCVLQHMESWLDQCPRGTGMNWRSPMELAIRLINWVWALELIRPSGLLRRELGGRIEAAAQWHLDGITRRYSRYSSANNHLVGEAAGAFIGSACFHWLPGAAKRIEKSRAILLQEIESQTGGDGVHRELALGYHLFVLQFFVLCGILARKQGRDFPDAYWTRLEKMFEFVAALVEGGRPPIFGDCDDGYVLDLGEGPTDARSLLAVGGALFNRADFKALAGGVSEPAFWLLNELPDAASDAEPARDIGAPIESRAFEDAGYYLLQCGHRDSDDRISVTFDGAPLGFGAIAAHGHADALSFTLRAGGEDILVDPGTYDYFTHREWRDYFRSTRAHNTITIDDRDQSDMLGLFLWGRRATVRRLAWDDHKTHTIVAAEHDGYQGAPCRATHRRSLRLDASTRKLHISDDIIAAAPCRVGFYLHFGENCRVHPLPGNRFRVDAGRQQVDVFCDARLNLSLVRGQEHPIGGWISRAYHQKLPAFSLAGVCDVNRKLHLKTRIAIKVADRDAKELAARDSLAAVPAL